MILFLYSFLPIDDGNSGGYYRVYGNILPETI